MRVRLPPSASDSSAPHAVPCEERRLPGDEVRQMPTRVGVLTGGGDCPGLNAVIRAIVRKAERDYGDEVVGFIDGWSGLLEDRWMPLDTHIAAHRAALLCQPQSL